MSLLLLYGFCACLFLSGFQQPFEAALFLGRRCFRFSVKALYAEDIHTADNSFHFLLYGNGIENFLIADQGKDLRSCLGLDDGQLGAALTALCYFASRSSIIISCLRTFCKQKGRNHKSPVDRAVAEGDTVLIDYEGKKDGVAFVGGTAQDAHLTIGSGQFIDGFEDGRILIDQ